MERRSFEIRRTVDTETRQVRGYAALFDSMSEDFGGFREVIRPGSFTQALRSADVRLLWNHDTGRVLARSTAGTLRVQEDGLGLAIEADLGEQTFARDALISMERGDVSQMSFGFTLDKDGYEWTERDGVVIREIKRVRSLLEVSLVGFPAYAETTAELARAQFRDYQQAKQDRTREQFLARIFVYENIIKL